MLPEDEKIAQESEEEESKNSETEGKETEEKEDNPPPPPPEEFNFDQMQIPEEFEGVKKDELSAALGMYKETGELAKFQAFAKEHGVAGKHVAKFVQAFAAHEVKSQQEFAAKQKAELGEGADKRLMDLAKWGKANFDDKQYAAIRGIAATADGVKFLESIKAKMAGSQSIPQPTSTTKESQREEYDRLMKSDAYLQEGHPDHVKATTRALKLAKKMWGEDDE